MSMHRLIIKGDAAEARKAAQEHGVTLVNAWAHQPNETHAYADCDNATLAKWFVEPPFVPPFSVGTLLHYTDGNSGDKR